MFFMFGNKDDRPFMLIGLTKANHERLPTKPIKFEGPYPMRVQDILILYGDDKPAIIAQLEQSGIEIPQEMKDDAARDPL